MSFLTALADRLGESDCEAFSNGSLEQPVNAWSSLAFTLVGLLIVVSATRADGQERTLRAVFGALLIATGIGSFLFHGPQPTGARFLHDITFLAAVWFLAVMNLAAALSRPSATGWVAFGVGVGVMALLLSVFPDVTNVLTGITLAGLVLAGVALQRRGGINGWWFGIALAASVIAIALLVGGRSGSTWCDPGSVYQAHGGWHVFAAIALGAYFAATSRARLRGRHPERVS